MKSYWTQITLNLEPYQAIGILLNRMKCRNETNFGTEPFNR